MKKSKKKKKNKGDVFKTGVILEGNKFKTPMGQLSFPALFKPDSYQGSDPKYKCTIIWDDDETDLTLLKKMGKQLVKEKFGKKMPKKLRLPWRDGEEREDTAGYGAGKTFMNVSSDRPPLIIDRKGKEITDETKIYAGCYVRLLVSPFTYDNKGKGLSFALLGVQLLKEGEAFGVSVGAEDFGEDDLSQFEDEELEETTEDDDWDDDDLDDW